MERIDEQSFEMTQDFNKDSRRLNSKKQSNSRRASDLGKELKQKQLVGQTPAKSRYDQNEEDSIEDPISNYYKSN